mgnify:CR=1 FL=1
MAAAPPAPATAAAPSNLHDKQFEDIVTQNQNHEHEAKALAEVVEDLENDDILETFKRYYKTIMNSYHKLIENEKRFIKKNTDLAAEISSCQLKVRSAEELSQGDKSTIDQLRKEITKAKNKITQSKETEVTLKERIKQLKLDIKELDSQLRKGPANVVGHDATVAELGRVKLDLQKDHDTQKAHVQAIQHDIVHLENRVAKVTSDKEAQDGELRALKQAIDLKLSELDDQKKRKERKEVELKDLKEKLTMSNRELIDQQSAITLLGAEITRKTQQVERTKEDTEKVVRDLAAFKKQTTKSEQEADDICKKSDQLKKEIASLTGQLKLKDGEVSGLRREQFKQAKLCDAIDKRNIVVDSQRAEAEAERDRHRAELEQLELSIANLTRQAENDRKQIEDLTRERDILNKTFLKAQSSTLRQKEWLVVKDNQRRNLEHQVRGFERHAQKQKEIIHQLEKETVSYQQEAIEAAATYAQTMEDVKQRGVVVIDRQKDIQDVESKLRQQQTLLDMVLNERNLYAKNYLLLHQEINEMKRKYKGMQALIDSLKAEIKVKEGELTSEEATVAKLEREQKGHESGIKNAEHIVDKREKSISQLNDELHKLNQIIAEAEAEKAKQRRDHVNVLNERDILGAQLIRRNDELATLYENIRIQQSMLHKGEAQYTSRLHEMQHLVFQVAQLRQELQGMRAFASRLPELKLLINKGSRELNREQCRVRALLDESDNPRNVHRFRRLAGREPQTALMHGKVLDMQRDLLSKIAEVQEKDQLISEKEKLYVELKAIIARQPGPEVAEQLNVYQESLQKKTGQMRAMKASLKHFQEQVEHYTSRYDELQGELRALNDDYVSRMKRAEKEASRRRIVNEMMGRPADAPDDEPSSGGEVYTGYVAPPRPQTSEGSDIPMLAPEELRGPPDSDDADGSGAAAKISPTSTGAEDDASHRSTAGNTGTGGAESGVSSEGAAGGDPAM